MRFPAEGLYGNPLGRVGLARSLGLSTEVGGGTGAGEETAKNGLEEGVEDDLSTATEGG